MLVPYAVEVDSQIINGVRPGRAQARSRAARWASTAGGSLCNRPVRHRRRRAPHRRCSTCSYERDSRHLRRPAADAGQQRDPRDRRLRPPGRLTPEALLNRWIVPLDRGIDYLTLDHGPKFEMPFDAKIVFSTNLRARDAGRRGLLPAHPVSKVLIPSITDDAVRRGPAPGLRPPRRDPRPRGGGTPPPHQPRAGRRRPAPLPPRRGLQDPHLDLHLRGPAVGAPPRAHQPDRPHVLHPHRRPGRRDPGGGRGPKARRHPDRRPARLAPPTPPAPSAPPAADPAGDCGGSHAGPRPRPRPCPRSGAPAHAPATPGVAAPAVAAALPATRVEAGSRESIAAAVEATMARRSAELGLHADATRPDPDPTRI